LSGWREALVRQIDAAGGDQEPFEVPFPRFTLGDGSPIDVEWNKPTRAYHVSAAEFWRGVPQRYRDRTRFVVTRKLTLAFSGNPTIPEEIRVFDTAGESLWTNGTDREAIDRPTSDEE
jgi:hypothetical protein